MAEKEPKPKTPRTRSTTTTAKKVTRKTTTRRKTVAESVVDTPIITPPPEPIVTTPSRERELIRASSNARGMSLGFLLSAIGILSAISAGSLYIGYTAEGQINVSQRLAEAPEEMTADDEFIEGEPTPGEPVPQGIPFGILEVAGDAAVPPPAAVTPEEASSTEPISEETSEEASAPETQDTEGAEATPPATEAIPPEASTEQTTPTS